MLIVAVLLAAVVAAALVFAALAVLNMALIYVTGWAVIFVCYLFRRTP